jgi:hypothetical protein
VKIQWVLLSSSSRSNFELSQKVSIPPEAPLALTAFPWPFFQKVFLAWRRSSPPVSSPGLEGSQALSCE